MGQDQPHPDRYDSDAIDQYLEARKPPEYLEARHGGDGDVMEFLNGVELETVRQLNVNPSTKPPVLLSDALSRYLSDHPKGHEPKFASDTQRVVDVVYGCVGDLPLAAYDRVHARAIRDTLAVGCKSATVERRGGTFALIDAQTKCAPGTFVCSGSCDQDS